MGEDLSPGSDILPLSWVGIQFYLYSKIAIRKTIKNHHACTSILSSVKVTNVKSAAVSTAGASWVPTPSKQWQMHTTFRTVCFVLPR